MTENQPERFQMGFFEHLGELRKRLLICLFGIGVLSVVAYFYSAQVFQLMTAPFFTAFKDQSLIGTGPAEAFLLKMKMAVLVGIVVAAPLIFWQVWQFIAPGLHAQERYYALPFVIITSLLFFLGMSFCYSLVLPVAFKFFSEQYASIDLQPTIRIGEHISFVFSFLLAFGVMFEMPALAFILARLGVIDHVFLWNGLRYAIVAIFVVAAILTPPDVLSQFLMAIPLMALYFLSILIAYCFRRS